MIDTNKVRAGLDKGVPADPGHLIDLARDLCDALDVQDEARRMAVGRMEKAEAAIERVRALCEAAYAVQDTLNPHEIAAALDGLS